MLRILTNSGIFNAIMGIEEIGSYYDKMVHEGYDEIYGNVVCKAEDLVLMNSLKRQFKGSRNILDIGCGTGLVSSYLDGDIRCTGIDVSLHELKSAAEKEIHSGRHYAQADMHSLPFPNRSFDLLISAYGPYSYSLIPDRLYKEFLRVLKPNGQFIVMPYTERTGKSIGLGGFSTAVEPSIKKIFYTQKLAEKTFSGLAKLEITGINYLPNLLLPKLNAGALSAQVTDSILKNEISQLSEGMGISIDLTKIHHTQRLLNLWNKFFADQTNVTILVDLLSEEIEIYKDTVPAHFARHMLVRGEKRS